ncbi:MAG: ribonuclease P protein component [Armatimonadetes bacterium]|nr:ribonuclease P protein component [Armatimonadota bacterium]
MRRIPQGSKRGDNKFPRNERLHRQRDFERCVKNGRALRGKLLAAYIYWHGEQMRRVAFSVGKAVGGAVVRNRIKRWLREAYRTRRWALNFGFDLLIVVRPTCGSVRREEIDLEFEQLLFRAGAVDKSKVAMAGEGKA